MNYASLKAAIQAVIKQNGNEEITGDLLQQSLLAMINALGVGYQFVGVATPATNPTIGDEKIMYIAVDSGTYPNFVTPAVTLDGSQIAIFLYSTSWSAILLNVPNGAYIATELAKKVDNVAGKGLSTNDYTDEDKTRVQNALLVSDIVDSLGDDTTKVISQAAMTEILLNYARIDGYYSSLIAGAAENLVGRGSVPALFTFRTTGGNADVGSGTAQIKKLYGNSIAWNQLVQNGNFANTVHWGAVGTFSVSDNIASITPSAQYQGISQTLNGIVSGHKYLVRGSLYQAEVAGAYIKGQLRGTNIVLPIGNDNVGVWKDVSNIFVAGTANNYNLGVGSTLASGWSEIKAKNIICIDLTLMFGQGKEPATVEEFEALYYLLYYAHNPGAIKNTTAIGIKTVGRNLFNPETGKAHLPGATGIADLTNGINCYQIIGNYTSITDEDGNTITPNTGGFFAVSSKQEITVVGGDDTTCICLTWSGYRNGEYEPYWGRTINLPLTTMTGKLNGEGESVVIAPDGWMSAGDARFVGIIENGMLTKVEKHVAQVDLGTLTWTKNTSLVTNTTVFVSSVITTRKPSVNLLTPKYVNVGARGELANRIGIATYNAVNNTSVIIRDDSLNDKTDAEVASALSGVPLYFELATEEVYVLDEPINMNYSEDDFGTEERLPADTDNVSAPIFFDVQYPMNAVDILRRLGVNYIKKESMDHILQAFVNAGIIGSYSLTYNSTNDDYDCVVTAPPVEP